MGHLAIEQAEQSACFFCLLVQERIVRTPWAGQALGLVPMRTTGLPDMHAFAVPAPNLGTEGKLLSLRMPQANAS